MSENSSGNKRIAKNTLLLYMRQLLIMVVSLYTSRVILETLGVDDFGIYNVVAGVVTMFSFVTSTMASASQRYLSYDMAKGDIKRLKETFGLVILTYVLLAVLTVILVEGVAVWFLNSKMTIPEDRIVAANWVLQFSLLTFIAHIFATPYLSLVISHEKMGVYAYVSIIDVILKLLIVYLIKVFLYDRLIVYSILMFLSTLVVTLSYMIYCRIKYEESHFKYYFEKKRFIDMTAFAWWNMIGSLANVLRSQGINVLLNMFFNPAVNAARGIAYQVNSAITSFSHNFYTAVKPQIVKSYASDNINRMHDLIFNSTRLAYYLVFIIAAPIFFYADSLMTIWLKNPPELTVLFVRVVLLNALIEVLSLPLVSGLQAANKIKALQLTVSILYLLNIPISYIFLKMGFPPVTPMYVNIAIVMVSFIPRILIARKFINVSIYGYIKNVLLRLFLVTTLGALIAFISRKMLTDDGSLMHGLLGAMIVIVESGVVVWFLGLTRIERKSALRVVINKIHK